METSKRIKIGAGSSLIAGKSMSDSLPFRYRLLVAVLVGLLLGAITLATLISYSQ